MNSRQRSVGYPGFSGDLAPVGDGGTDAPSASATAPMLTVAMLLFSYHLWRVGGVNVTVSDVVFITVVFIELSLARLNGAPFGVLTPLWLGSLLLMLVGLFLGSFFNGDMTRWLIVAAQYLFSYMLLPMLLIRDRKVVERLILVLIAGMAAMESIGIAAYYLVDGHQQTEPIFGVDFITGSHRLGAMLGDANWNAIVIAMTLPFVIYCARRRLISSLMAVGAVLILCWALTLAASFTGFSAAVISILVMVVAGRLRPSPKIAALGLVVVATLYVSGYQMPEIFAKRVAPALQNASLDGAGTYDDRAELIKEAWELAERTTIIGLGADKFRDYSAVGQPVHNIYMLQLTEGGVLALVGWLGLVFAMILIPLVHLRKSPLEASLGLAVIVVFTIFTVASPHMYARFLMVPVMLSLGIVLATQQALPPLGEAGPRNRTGATRQMY